MSDINYKCTIVKIDNLHKHPNADKLQLSQIFGNTVIVGLDVRIGDLGLFFMPESKIGSEFLKANNLYRDSLLNTDNTQKGLFESNGRVRSMKLRGVISCGYWCELDYLSKTVSNYNVAVGDSFNEYSGVEISTKYIPYVKVNPNTNMQSRKKHDRFIKDQFKEHFETEHLFKNLDRIQPDDQLVITFKLHGTSARAGNVLVKRKLSLLEKTLRFFGTKIQDTEYSCLYGSRKVIKDVNNKDQQHWYDSDLWTSVGKSNFEGKLHKGESVYYEIIGYVPGTQTMIQKGFPYGCKEGQCEIYVYRITNTNSDGVSVDLFWEALKERCIELGVKYVPEADNGILMSSFGDTKEEILNIFKEVYLEKDSVLDSNTVEEGICVRVEKLKPVIYKVKSQRFLLKESEQLDTQEVDIETEQS